MSSTQFIEALSADPFVKELSRRAIRILNDPTLDRQQREDHIRRLQSLLVGHQVKEAAMGKKLPAALRLAARMSMVVRRLVSVSFAPTPMSLASALPNAW